MAVYVCASKTNEKNVNTYHHVLEDHVLEEMITPSPTKGPVEFQAQHDWTEEACDVELLGMLPAEPASMNAGSAGMAGLVVVVGTSLADLMVLALADLMVLALADIALALG